MQTNFTGIMQPAIQPIKIGCQKTAHRYARFAFRLSTVSLMFLLMLVAGIAGAQQTSGTADLIATLNPAVQVGTVGKEVTFTSIFTNNGPDTATNVSLEFEWWNYGMEFVSAESTVGTVVKVAPNNAFNWERVKLPAMASGETVVMTVKLLPTAVILSGGFTARIYSEHGNTIDPDVLNSGSEGTLETVQPGMALWDLTGAPMNAEKALNDDMTFEVAVSNRGPAELTSVTVLNSLVTFDQNSTATDGVAPAPGAINLRTEVVTEGDVRGVQANGIHYTIDAIAPNSSVTLRFTYTATQMAVYWMRSSATVPQEQSDTPEKTASGTIRIREFPPLADLSVHLSADNTEVPFSQNAVVHLSVTNNGPAPAYDVVAEFAGPFLNPKVDYISETATVGQLESFVGGDIISSGKRMRVPVLNPGQTESMTLTFRKRAFEPLLTGASVRCDSTRSMDGNSSDNIAGLTIYTTDDPPVFDLEAVITASPAMAQPGGLLVYTMSVRNNGPDDVPSTVTLSNVWVKKTYPQWGPNGPMGPITFENSGVIFRSIQDAGNWNLESDDRGLVASLPYLAAGDTASLVLVYNVSPDAVGDDQGNINSSIGVQCGLYEQNKENNAATAVTPVHTGGGNPGADLLVTQISSPARTGLNQPVSYSVSALNLGPNPIPDAYVGSLVPEGATLAGVAADKGTPVVVKKYASVSNVSLAVGESVTMTVNILPRATGPLATYSGASSDVFDPDITNNYAEESMLITDSPQDPVVEDPIVTPDPPEGPACTEPVNLKAQIIKIRKKSKVNKKTGLEKFTVQTQVGVTNVGTQCSPKTVVKLYWSDDLELDVSDVLLGVKSLKPTCPGKKPKKVSFKLNLAKAVTPLGPYLIAVADEDGIIPECDELDNMAVAF